MYFIFLEQTSEGARELMTAIIEESTDNFIVRDNEKIVAMHSLKKGFIKEKPKQKQRLEDYGFLVGSGTFKHKRNNIIMTLLDASESNMFKNMEPPCKYFYGMLGAVHPKYHGKKVAEAVVIGLIKYCIDEGAKYYCGDNTNDKIANLFCKLPGFEIVDKFYYSDFKIHGTSVINQLVDGSKHTCLCFCDLEKHKNAYLKNV
uniref:N-acetyltransferase domain-containing protein n=1 Tax=Panagrolaimus superbus TaxID=310955 RepID=A0A914Y5C9_9BILA